MARQSPRVKAAGRKPLEAVSESTSPGGLHRSLGIPIGQKIGAARIEAATKSPNLKTRRQANLAQTYAKHRP
jgi:hypothetical protein